MSTPDCPFCEIVANHKYTYETPGFLGGVGFEPLNPVTPGHFLIVPKPHVEHGGPESSFHVAGAMEAAHLYAKSRGEDYNLITSSGPAATQTVPHIHVHYVPRRQGDGLPLPWTNQNGDTND